MVREQHKIAVFYIGETQCDKVKIIGNNAGSAAFNTFVRSLGWMVQLSTHAGYSGKIKPENFKGEEHSNFYEICQEFLIFVFFQ